MSSNAIFVHDLSNDLFVIEMLTSQLPESEIVNKISKMLAKIKEKCTEHLTSDKVSNVNLSNEVKNIVEHYDSKLDIDLMKRADPMLQCSKNRFQDLLHNICKNAIEAKATRLQIAIRSKSILINDNGHCTSDIVAKLNAKIHFTDKIYGNGIGVSSIRKFCKDYNVDLEFMLVPSIDGKFGQKGLGIKFVFNEPINI